MRLAKLLEEAARIQIRFASRDDAELQALRADKWGAVEKEIERMIDERIQRKPDQRRK